MHFDGSTAERKKKEKREWFRDRVAGWKRSVVGATFAYESNGRLLRANCGLRARRLGCWRRTSGGLWRSGVGNQRRLGVGYDDWGWVAQRGLGIGDGLGLGLGGAAG